MNELLIFVFIILNFGISWWNAWATGSVWPELAQAPTMYKVVGWSGAVMSTVGFTWVYMVLLGLGAAAFELIDRYWLDVMFSLGYLTIIIPALVSGLVIWLHSLMVAWRKRSLSSVGIAGWTTFAQGYNTYQAVSAIPDALSTVIEAFGGSKSRSSSSDSKGAAGLVVILLVLLALVGGVLTTCAIMRYAMRNTASRVLRQRNEAVA